MIAFLLCFLGIDLELGFPADVAPHGVIIVRAAGGTEQTLPVASRHVTLEALPETTLDVDYRDDEWWAPRQTIVVTRDAQRRTVPVLRYGTISGGMIVAKSEPLPSKLELEIGSPPQPDRSALVPAATKVTCPIDGAGKWICRLPATALDLTLRVGNFVPEYRWDVQVPPETPRNLGDISLRKGGSVTATLDPETLKTIAGPVRARLVRVVVAEPSLTTARMKVPVAEAPFGPRGFVQLAPVGAGTYTLEVSATGYATSRIGPVETYEGRESVVRQAIRLEKPLAIRINVQPPTDPYGKPWVAELRRRNDFAAGDDAISPVSESANDAGVAVARNQSPGNYRVVIFDSRRNRMAEDDFTVTGVADAEHTITTDVVLVRGTVKLGDDPLKAALWFGGRSGATSIRIDSDEEGEFRGALPHPGAWVVDVFSGDSLHSTTSVVVTEKDLEIVIPDTTLSGWVTSPDGSRKSGADVMLSGGATTITATTDSSGTFTFRGVPARSLQLQARDRQTGARSDPVTVDVALDTQLAPVELRLRSNQMLTGRITSRGAPAAGARLSIYAMVGARAEQTRAVTQLDGSFEARIIESAKRALIVVSAPSRALQAFEVAVEEPVVLDVASVGGTLTIVMPKGNQRYRLTANGVVLPQTDLLSWIRAHGMIPAAERFVVPDIAPGFYRACLATSDSEKCATGTLGAGGSLELDLTK